MAWWCDNWKMKACESSARKTTMAGTGTVSDQSAATTCFIMTCLIYLFRCFRCRRFDASSSLPTTTRLVPVHPPGGKILGSAKRQRLVLPDPNDARPRLMTGPTPKNIYFLINVQLFILTILKCFNWNSYSLSLSGRTSVTSGFYPWDTVETFS